MSILTKICVVILLVLVLIACPVFISMATVPQNYKALYRAEQQASQLHQINAQYAEMARQQAVELANAARDKAEDIETRLTQKNQALQAQLAAAQTVSSNVQTQLAELSARMGELDKTYDAYLKQQQRVEEQLADARRENAELAEENRKVTELLRQAQGDIERLEKVARVLREEKAEADRTIEDLQEKLAQAETRGGPTAAEPTEVTADREITGTVTVVRDDLAGINVGSANGVRENMKLIIHRGDRFVGYLRVSEVDVNSSAGFIVDNRLDVMRGDKVTTLEAMGG